jgi:chromosome segregation ATPase
MLVIHSSSVCDVCYGDYHQHKNPPSAVPCGHIFCYRCLTACQPSICPLCRKSFTLQQITKLRTDSQSAESEKPHRSRASSSTSLRHERESGAKFDQRVVSHLKDTKDMVHEVTERIKFHEAVEESLKYRLLEVERERDSYFRKLADVQTSLLSAKMVEDSLLARLQRTVSSYETKIDDMDERLQTAEMIERSLLDQVAKLRTRDFEYNEQLQRSRAISSHLLSRIHGARMLDPFNGLILPNHQ